MKLLNLLKITALAFLFFFYNSLKAQTIETNIPGLVIKNYKCGTIDGRTIFGDLINRNNESFKGRVRVKIFDSDNDIVWQGTDNMTVLGQNGRSLVVTLGVGKCTAPYRVQISLEQ
jgi:hypothetical protein